MRHVVALAALTLVVASACDGGSGENAAEPTTTTTTPGTTTPGTTSTPAPGDTTSPPGTVAPPQGLPSLTCGASEVKFQGTLGGAPLSESLSASASVGGYALAAFDGGAIAVTPEFIDDTTTGVTGGAILFPPGSSHAGQVFCTAPGTLISRDNDTQAALVGSLLGACSTAPEVPGTLYRCVDGADRYCTDGGAPELQPFGGTIDGTAVTLGTAGSSFQRSGSVAVSMVGDYKFALFASGMPTTTAPVSITGILFGAIGGADSGAVYCIGGGTWQLRSDASSTEGSLITMTNLRRVGSCAGAPAAERIDACY